MAKTERRDTRRNPQTWVRALLFAVAGPLCIVSAPCGAAPIPDTYPWVNVDSTFAAAIRAGRVVPVTPGSGWGMTLADGGVYMLGSDVSGWARSLDGINFETANSGRAFSTSVCGGYTATATPEQGWYTAAEQTSGWNVDKCGAGKPLAVRAWVEGGPPSARLDYPSQVAQTQDVASGPLPAALAAWTGAGDYCRGPHNEAACAGSVMYAASQFAASFSPDAGRQWYPMPAQCRIEGDVTYTSIGVDQGRPGHVVMLSRHGKDENPYDAGGCAIPATDLPKYKAMCKNGTEVCWYNYMCANRVVAWTDDVGPQLVESMSASATVSSAAYPDVLATRPDGKMRTERAGGGLEPSGSATDGYSDDWARSAKWRYSTVSNLPAPAVIGGACAVAPDSLKETLANMSGFQATVPGDTCFATKDPSSGRCHGRKSSNFQVGTPLRPADRDAWCLDTENAACQCRTGHEDHCRYPETYYVEVDPTNGYAYMSTSVGLLTSPDGGGHWIRQGGAPANNPADVMMVPNDPVPAGCESLAPPLPPNCKMPSPLRYDPVPGFVPAPSIFGAVLKTQMGDITEPDTGAAREIDLNRQPARIGLVGRVSFAFQPCQNGAKYSDDPSRVRGSLTAAVPVTWNQGTTAKPEYISSVFVARRTDSCTGTVERPGALTFYDTRNIHLASSGPCPIGAPSFLPYRIATSTLVLLETCAKRGT